MEHFLIEDGILKAYTGREKVVVVPAGVTQVGGELRNEPDDYPRNLRGDYIGYKAFYYNKHLEELYLPDSVEEIGFKALEHATSLKVLSFSSKMKTFGCNSILGCDALTTIIYRGTKEEFAKLNLYDYAPNLETVYCTDGKISMK